MTLEELKRRMSLPVIGAPLFIISTPDLVIAQCKAGIVGSFPALNARPADQLEVWLERITRELAEHDGKHPDRPAAPFAVNQIVHKSNERLESDMELCARYKVPLIITSLGARADVNEIVHGYGGLVFHDVINQFFARKAIEKGADGLIAVAAGAGGHAGKLSPFALVQETRDWFEGPIALSGSIATGRAILAAQAMGADFAYVGTPFIATSEANAPSGYKEMICKESADEVVYTNLFTGVWGNYLKPSIRKAGLDPDALEVSDPSRMTYGRDRETRAKAWRDIWGAGQGIGAIKSVQRASDYIAGLATDYAAARADLLGAPFARPTVALTA